MKKTTICLFLVILMLFTTTIYAGDIPESYLLEDVQMFFGEVLYYNNNKDMPSIEVSPIKKIKGNVKEGTKQIYISPYIYGNFEVKQDDIYLFVTRPNKESAEIFCVTTFDTNTLKLKYVEGGMWERFEEYINEGRYGVAKIEERTTFDFKLIVSIILGLFLCIGSLVIFKRFIKK